MITDSPQLAPRAETGTASRASTGDKPTATLLQERDEDFVGDGEAIWREAQAAAVEFD